MAGKTPNPWDRPHPLPTSGSPTPEGIYAAVGAALSRWERVEGELVFFFRRMTGLDIELAFVICGTLPSHASKQAMIISVAEHVYKGKPEHLSFLKEIMKIIGKLSERRSDIAHGIVNKTDSGYF